MNKETLNKEEKTSKIKFSLNNFSEGLWIYIQTIKLIPGNSRRQSIMGKKDKKEYIL